VEKLVKKIQNAHKREILRMANKSGSQKEFKHTNEKGEEVTYTFQYPGLREAVKIRDRSKNQFGGLIEEKYYDELMKHVIVSPKTSWDYWEENEGFEEVLAEAGTFLNS
jgi:hypothetical protein